MIKLVNVSKYYTSGDVTNLGLRNINLDLYKGEIVAIVGESGSGKSTLLNVITKMDNFDEGEIYYKGNETSYFGINDMDNFRKNKVGFTFQNYNIIDSYTVLENVMLPYTINGEDNKAAKAKAIELIEKVGLKKRMHNRGSQLSGGEKQRCVIARALASNAEILACDEPTGNLDSKTSAEIISLIKEVASDKLVLIVTHNFESIAHIATRKIVVHDGEILEDIKLKDVETQDQDVPLDLDYVALPKKISLHIAVKNILKTPRKTILTSLVFLFVCLFAISLYQAIMYLNTNEDKYNPFVYQDSDKLLVYDINHSELDLNYFNTLKANGLIYDYTFNKFYGQKTIYAYDSQIGDTSNYEMIYTFGYESNPSNFSEKKLSGGRLSQTDDEIVLLISSTYSFEDSDILDKTVEFYDDNGFRLEKGFKVVGYQYRKDIKEGCAVITGNKLLENYFTSTTLFSNYGSRSVEFNIYNGEETVTASYIIQYDFNLDKTTLTYNQLALNVTKAEIGDYYYGNYKLFDGFEIETAEMEEKEAQDPYIYYQCILRIGKDVLDKIDDHPYEVFIYSNMPKIVANKLENEKNYSSLNISTYSPTSELEKLVNNLWGYLAIVLSSFSLFVIYFISYFVLSKIYQSKKKDYTIIRTLGVTKKDMKTVVTWEVFITTIILSIFVYLVVFILGKTIHKQPFLIFADISFFTTFLYFVVMLTFALLISRRFNARLFKFSVNQTLKAEEVKND